MNNKKREPHYLEGFSFLLGYPDSNQERQDQNLQCYHYTIAQSFVSLQGGSSPTLACALRGWATRTRTRKGRTRICSVTITP